MADTHSRSLKTAGHPERQRAIEEFLRRFADSPDQDLLGEMMVTICRLAADGTGRGELKLLNSAVKELRYAFKIFAPYSQIRKVTIFGSSRTPPDHPEYLQADRFARGMRENDWMVITGAGDGIMRAGHDGAGRDASFGVAIRLPFEQKTNPVIADDAKLVNFKYFFTRKLVFMKEASAVVLFPGGFGTQDEGFEALTLVQTGKSAPIPIVMIDAPGGFYWQHWRTYVAAELLRTNMISPEDMNLFKLTDDAGTAVQEIIQFYRRYHSSRYVNDLFVMRLNSPLSADAVERLNDTFGGIMTGGRIEQYAGPIEGENDELPDKARLTLAFDRKSVGRLRLLINEVNRA
ncbi:MAG TPA: LOG family protein [Phycisphaerae bacterium]|nr:LOG family protein [Phycisphaerae bacterium]HRY69459.1 LOG family protein [Phycisphaerae bacterium]HSA26326.1 LOG family protein [Phycisphaerae bacterium]